MDRLCIHQERFEKWSSETKVSQICESDGFMRKVSIGQHFRTIQGVNDGFGGKTGSCREYTLPRDQDSEPIGWISGRTRIGPVRQVKTICCLDQEGIEIQVPSTSRDGSNSRIVISRGPNRSVDEPWHDQDDSPENGEMVSSTSVERSHAITPSIEENSCVEATGTIESDELPFQKSSSSSTKGSGMIFLPTVMWKGILLSGNLEKNNKILYDISTLLNRDIDGAVRWSSLCSKLRREFEKEGARTFTDSQWLGYIHRGSNKPRGRSLSG